MKKLPTCKQVMGRVQTLQKENNGKNIKIAINIVSEELQNCWKKQDMPVQLKHNIATKIYKLYQKKICNDQLFDVLPAKACFKCKEDERYYANQKKASDIAHQQL